MNESTAREELFGDILDNVEEYLEIQKLMHSKLREGYLSVARARISGVLLPPSPNNTSSLNQRSSSSPADQQQPKWELSTNPTGKPTTTSREEEEEEKTDAGNSIIHELAAKYGCETPTTSSSRSIEKKAGLTSPLLKQAESDFNQALHLLVHMANLQYRVKSQLQSYTLSL